MEPLPNWAVPQPRRGAAKLATNALCAAIILPIVFVCGCGRVGYDALAQRDGGPTPDASAFEYVWFECESGVLVGAMTSVPDAAASGDAYATVAAGPPEWQWSASSPSLPPDRVELSFTLAHAGAHVVWVRFEGLTETADRWYAGFEAADLRRLFDNTAHGSFTWLRGNNDEPALLTFDLPAGPHTLVLGPGEAGPRCDRVLVTDDPSFVPGP